MNEKAMLHIPDTKYCYPVSDNEIELVLRMDKDDFVDKVEVLYESKYTIYLKQRAIEMTEKFKDRLYKYYIIRLKLEDVRLAYVFRIWQGEKMYYYSEDGISETYDFKIGHYNYFQMAFINENDVHKIVPWMKKAVFYQIFVDRFFRASKEKDDSYINMKWGEIPNPKSFAGGDLAGITEKMDYIKELGANTIYLTPIFESQSNHKYDIIDYRKIDPMFGDNEEFRNLVKKAHEMGMRVVLDAVFNHCSIYAPQFQDVLKNGNRSPYYSWFLIHGEQVDVQKMNYEVFSFCNYMPKFNTANEEVQAYLIDIATYWVEEYDIDGWRLDVSDEISHGFWRKFRDAVKKTKEDCVIIGENWHDANSYLKGDQYDSIMNYAFSKACLDYYTLESFGAQEFSDKLSSLLMRNTVQVNQMMLNLLDSHDTDRFYTSVAKNGDKVLSAIAVMCMYVGAPCIYYGTELMLEGGYDPDNRRCFNWNEEEWDHTFMEQLQRILRLKQDKVLQSGEIHFEMKDDLFYLYRSYGEKKIILITNQSGSTKKIEMNGTLLVQNKYAESEIENDGFVIMKQSDRMWDTQSASHLAWSEEEE